MDYSTINSICDQYAQQAVQWRRDFHKHPEPAWTEFRTTAKIAEILEAQGIRVLMGKQVVNPEYVMGYPSAEVIEKAMARAVAQGAKEEYVKRTEGYTGACALIETGRPGPVTGMRFDIDSNDVCENKTTEHRPTQEGFASVNDNAMHACGHDGHAATGLVTALVLNQIKENLCGTIKVIFQPSEEGVRGALSVCKSGILDDVQFMLGGHIGDSEDGSLQVSTNTGGYLATDKFDVFFKGEASHAGGSPEKGRNALLAAALATLGMQTQVQDGRGIGRCNVGKLVAGTGRNVIAAEAMLCVETRGTTSAIAKDIYRHAMDSIEGAAKMYGCTYQVKKMGPLKGILSKLPGVGNKVDEMDIDDSVLDRSAAIILSMTPFERSHPDSLDASRKRRIAAGCGMKVEDVNRLLNQFKQTQKMMKQFGGGKGKRRKMMMPPPNMPF